MEGVAQNWLKSYLNNSFQHVKMNDTESDLGGVTCGIPQGSALLFLLYIDNICTVYLCSGRMIK